jgi:hypothetical protein
MTDWRTQLRDVLNQDEQDRLSVEDVDAMRREVLRSLHARDEGTGAWSWLQPLVVAATVVAMVGVGVGIGQHFDARTLSIEAESDRGGVDGIPASGPQERARQLQFSMPGGTRIIWIFNSDLELKTTP